MYDCVSVAVASGFVMERRFIMFPERPAEPVSNVVAFGAAHRREQGLDKHLGGSSADATKDVQTSETQPSFWMRLFLSFSAACCLVSVMPISGAQPGKGSHPDDGQDMGG